MKIRHVFILIALLVLGCKQMPEKDIAVIQPDKNYEVEHVIEGLTIPWGMVWLPDGSMLITEKSGDLYHFKNDEKIKIENLPNVYDHGQGGLLDIALHPNYATNQWIYITYASKEGGGKGGNTALIRCKLKGNALTDIELLYKATPNTTASGHFGSRIAFDNHGFVYFSIGDRFERDKNPQDITRDGGKIYRLHDDGSIPEDNPFYTEHNAKKAIYTYGNRNPQGMVKHPETGDIWMHEHGPKGGDEINIVKKGANYGWPVVSYGINYDGTILTEETSRPEMEPPLYYWVPSIAPCGMDFVTGDNYPDWKNKLLVGSLKFGYVELLTLEGEKVTNREKLADGIGRVRNVKMGPDDLIYIAVEGRGIFRLTPP
jgi:glucose/arabinose dehydrogenase